MKCPKCGYIGFDAGERCRNCGYDFSLAVPVAPADDDAPPVPRVSLEDLDLHLEQLDRARSARSETPPDLDTLLAGPPAGSRTDLPLFAAATPQPQPVQAQPPLAVRRPAPATPRLRPRAIPRIDRDEVPPGLLGDTEVRPPDDAAGPGPAPTAAAPVPRLLAAAIDVVLLAALDLAVVYFTLRVCRLPFAEIGLLPVVPLGAFLAALDAGYLMAFTLIGGQTIGKMASGIRVVDQDGGPLAFPQAVIRTVACAVVVLPAGLGLVPGLLGEGRLALHDRIANTRVIAA